MSAFRRLTQVLALGCAAVALPGAAFASAYEFASAPTSMDRQLSLGFSFTANSALTLTRLGYFDDGGDGFDTRHTVGLFNTSGTLLTSTTLGAGTANPLTGHFRYQAIVPFTLVAGAAYTLAATTGGQADAFAYGSGTSITGLQTDPSITIGANAALFLYQSDDVLRDPTDHYKDYTLYAGPNFLTASIPEPGTVALLVGALTVGWLGRRLSRPG